MLAKTCSAIEETRKVGRTIEILDTTLRDGEQTNGVTFSSEEKFQGVQFLLQRLNVDRVEIASARVSSPESAVFKRISTWAKEAGEGHKIEILGFVDHGRSVEWMLAANLSVINFLTKGSRKHCELQLRKTQSQHLNDIAENVQLAKQKGLTVNAFLEDWSNGCLESPDYVKTQIAELVGLGLERIYLPDTLGIFSPQQTYRAMSEVCQAYPDVHFEFHGHNDYDLAVANCLVAIDAGARGLHVTVNGLGERAGNTPLESVVCAIQDQTAHRTSVREQEISTAALLFENYSGKKNQSNRPIVGQDVFTQTAGVHADGDKKARLYVSALEPNRFGRKHIYALGKQAGIASIKQNLKTLGIELEASKVKILLERVKQLGEHKHLVTIDDLPLLIRDIFDSEDQRNIIIEDVTIHSSFHKCPQATLQISINKHNYRAESDGDGGYDAFMHALKKVKKQVQFHIAELVDYEIHIPPGGRADALVRCSISWETSSGQKLYTVGVSTDQVKAAIFATEKMLNRIN